MKSTINWFEIPVTDFERAKKFFSTIFDFEMSENKMGEYLMGFFPFEDISNSGAIIFGEGYVPSTEGIVIYFSCGDDLNGVLSKIEDAGGKIIVPKTLITEEHGYFAYFLDAEGNKLALHSRG